MVKCNLLEFVNGFGSVDYFLTPSGWIEGLQVVGLFNEPSFREKAGQLSRSLKNKVKGRQDNKQTNIWELASETGLSESFIFNAIDSHLLQEMFNQVDAYWAPDGNMKEIIIIPARFGIRRP